MSSRAGVVTISGSRFNFLLAKAREEGVAAGLAMVEDVVAKILRREIGAICQYMQKLEGRVKQVEEQTSPSRVPQTQRISSSRSTTPTPNSEGGGPPPSARQRLDFSSVNQVQSQDSASDSNQE